MTGPAALSAETHQTWGRGLRGLWAFEDDMVFFNQGAFGAALREVLREQDAWRTRMERQTGRFFMNDLPGLLAEVTRPVAAFAGSVPERTLMVENASTGLMTAMTALSFRPGDRIVITDHVYGAVRKALQHVCRLTGAEIAEVAVPLPVKGPSDFLQPLAEAIDARTRLVVIDHVTSPSSLVLPVAEIAALCREAGTRLLVDASHAPGLVEVEADSIGADFYVANCHKWLCAPKGAAFMVVGEAAAAELELHPLVISHAYGQGLSAEFAKIGTRDPSAWLSVPAAIDAHERLGGARLRARDAQLARSGGRLVAERLGTEVSGPDEMISGMVSVRLPGAFGEASWPRAGEIRDALWHSARIEALVAPHSGALWLRLCTFAYTEPEEFDLVAAAVSALLRKEARP